jgi:hypothetical protein
MTHPFFRRFSPDFGRRRQSGWLLSSSLSIDTVDGGEDRTVFGVEPVAAAM